MDDSTVKIGLLLEAAEAYQASAATALDGMRAHVIGLDGVVREEIRATLVEELKDLREHSQLAAASLRALARRANARVGLLGVSVVLLASATPVALSWWLLPDSGEIAALRDSREQMTAGITRLRREGAAVDLKRCGPERRLCARVDRTAPRYGEASDYLVLKGY